MFEKESFSEKEIRKHRKNFIKRRILILSGEIDEDKSKILRGFIYALNERPKKEIILYIDSIGGDVEPGLWLYDTIRLSLAPIKGIVNGRASSMAALVLQACQKRVAMEHSQLLLHAIRSHGIPMEDEDKINEEIEKSREIQERVHKILVTRTGRSFEEIKALEKKDKYISAKEAKEFGLIDEII